MNQLIQNKVKHLLSEKRYSHSLAVADTAKRLVMFWGSNPEKAYLAGLLHDIGKELSLSEMQDSLSSATLLPEEKRSKELLHAKAGARIAKKIFGIDDQEILKAIEEHTIGGEKMSTLSKILYVSDYIALGRTQDGVEEARRLSFEDLDQTMGFILERTLQYLKVENKWIHPLTEKVLNQILSELDERRIKELDGKRNATPN